MNSYIRKNRCTIKSEISFSGIGIHSGIKSTIKLSPAEPKTGIVFIYDGVHIPAIYSNVVNTNNCTQISANGKTVSTIEHIMSTLSALGIDDCFIETTEAEIPIMDGSSLEFTSEILKLGIVESQEKLEYLSVNKNIEIKNGDISIKLSPSNDYIINAEIDFTHPKIGYQSYETLVNKSNFAEQISPARTFGFLKDFKPEKKQGLGGSVDTAIVFDEEKNTNPLRFDNECVRHKILDIIGDFALSAYPLICRVDGCKMGHKINNLVLHKLFENKDNYKIITY